MPALKPKGLRSWDATQQAAYRTQHPDTVTVWHILLDASPSMLPHADALLAAYNRYLAFLKTAAPPMSVAEVRCFAHRCPPSPMQALGTLAPLRRATYRPEDGHGTALYDAVGQVCSTSTQVGSHMLLLFTDGEDAVPPGQEPGWRVTQVHALLTTLQADSGWLCLFLGAEAAALEEAVSMGFQPGNCLLFASEQLPEAFQQLQAATVRYLTAPPAQQKQLAAGGVF